MALELWLVALALYVLGMPLYCLAVARKVRRQARESDELLYRLMNRVAVQEQRLNDLMRDTQAPGAAPSPAYEPNPEAQWPVPQAGATPARQPPAAEAGPAPLPEAPAMPEPEPALRAPPATPSPEPAAPPPWLAAAEVRWQQARQQLFSGNLVAKAGLLILFIGISFLLKYTAAHVTVPVELRLASIGAGALALLAWAWRIRDSRPAISLPVQGTALAMLILVTFGAYRIYHLLPSIPAFGLLVLFVAFTCLLAVLQDAIWLAVFGIVGGFATPILASAGDGSHIVLFSYFAILNTGILAIAVKRSWRILNLLGFAFTFVLGTAWGVLRYQPEHYLSTQLFLALFVLFYIGIALFYASHQVPRLAHYVDGTLIFGTPLVALGLQYGLVRNMHFGMAFSALTLGILYVSLALALWRIKGRAWQLMAESFLALGVVFGTLALPFALDGRWTAAAWAIEGAGVVWVGLRQRQRLAWGFGLLVQAGSWFSFLAAIAGLDQEAARHANLWLGFLILAVTALAMSVLFRNSAGAASSRNRNRLAALLLVLATIWLLAGAWTEIGLRTTGATQQDLLTGGALAVAAIAGVLAARLAWPLAGQLAVAVQLVAGIVFLVRTRWAWLLAPAGLFDGPFLSALMLGLSLFLSSVFFARQARAADKSYSAMANNLLPAVALCWYGIVLSSWASWLGAQYAPHASPRTFDLPYGYSFYIIAAGALGTLALHLARRLEWPALRWLGAPVWLALGTISAAMLSILYAGDQTPGPLAWAAYGASWAAAEYALYFWPRAGWPWKRGILMALHLLRIAVPWLMIWPVLGHAITLWLLAGAGEEQRLLRLAGWTVSASWARYLPAWAMLGALGLLMRQALRDAWPLRPLASWHRRITLPLATAWAVLLAALWNLVDNGAMAPLPYLPLLNPLDITTGFALLLAAAALRLHPAWHAGLAPGPRAHARLADAWSVVLFIWFNLILLRSVANYMDLPYRFDALLASRFVQTMLSLVWSVSALVLMRHAAQRGHRRRWCMGAALLGLVVLKLFVLDLSGAGSIERIVSFIGAGLLMVAIGYLAPIPARATST